jgi:hypothetical protein
VKPYSPPKLSELPPRSGEACAAIEAYIVKNGYAPTYSHACFQHDVACVQAMLEAGLIEKAPLYEGGPLVKVLLTEKGAAVAALYRDARRRS